MQSAANLNQMFCFVFKITEGTLRLSAVDTPQKRQGWRYCQFFKVPNWSRTAVDGRSQLNFY